MDSTNYFLPRLLCFAAKLNNLHPISPSHPHHNCEMEVIPCQENLPQKRVLMVSSEKKQKSGLMVSREKKRRKVFRVKTENQFFSLLVRVGRYLDEGGDAIRALLAVLGLGVGRGLYLLLGGTLVVKVSDTVLRFRRLARSAALRSGCLRKRSGGCLRRC